jgi:hypothetical protein
MMVMTTTTNTMTTKTTCQMWVLTALVMKSAIFLEVGLHWIRSQKTKLFTAYNYRRSISFGMSLGAEELYLVEPSGLAVG